MKLLPIFEETSKDPLGDVYRKCYDPNPTNGWDIDKLEYYSDLTKRIINNIVKSLDIVANVTVFNLVYNVLISDYKVIIRRDYHKGHNFLEVYVRNQSTGTYLPGTLTLNIITDNVTEKLKEFLKMFQQEHLTESASNDPLGDVYRKCYDPPKYSMNDEKIKYYRSLIVSIVKKLFFERDGGVIVMDRGYDICIDLRSGIHVTIFNNNGHVLISLHNLLGDIITHLVWYPDRDASLTDTIKTLMVTAKRLDKKKLKESVSDDPLAAIYKKCLSGRGWDIFKLNYYADSIDAVLKNIINKVGDPRIRLNPSGNMLVSHRLHEIECGAYYIFIQHKFFTDGLGVGLDMYRGDVIQDRDNYFLSKANFNLTERVTQMVKKMTRIKQVTESVGSDPLAAIYKKCLTSNTSWNYDKLNYYADAIDAVLKNIITTTGDPKFKLNPADNHVLGNRIHEIQYGNRYFYINHRLSHNQAITSVGLALYDRSTIIKDDNYFMIAPNFNLTDRVKELINKMKTWNINEAVENDPLGKIFKKLFDDERSKDKIAYYGKLVTSTLERICISQKLSVKEVQDASSYALVGPAARGVFRLEMDIDATIRLQLYKNKDLDCVYISAGINGWDTNIVSNKQYDVNTENMTKVVIDLIQQCKRDTRQHILATRNKITEAVTNDPLRAVLMKCVDGYGMIDSNKRAYFDSLIKSVCLKLIKTTGIDMHDENNQFGINFKTDKYRASSHGFRMTIVTTRDEVIFRSRDNDRYPLIDENTYYITDTSHNLSDDFVNYVKNCGNNVLLDDSYLNEDVQADPVGEIYRKCLVDGKWNLDKLEYFRPMIKTTIKRFFANNNVEADVGDSEKYKNLINITIDGIVLLISADGRITSLNGDRKAFVNIRGLEPKFKRVVSNATWHFQPASLSWMLLRTYQDIKGRPPMTEAVSNDPLGDIYIKAIREDGNGFDELRLNYYKPLIKQLLSKVIEKDGGIVSYSGPNENAQIKFDFGHINMRIHYGSDAYIDMSSHEPKYGYNVGIIKWTAGSGVSLTQRLSALVAALKRYYRSNVNADELNEAVSDDPIGTVIRKTIAYNENKRINKYTIDTKKIKYYTPMLNRLINDLVVSQTGLKSIVSTSLIGVYQFYLGNNEKYLLTVNGGVLPDKPFVMVTIETTNKKASNSFRESKIIYGMDANITAFLKSFLNKHIPKSIIESTDKDPLGDIVRKSITDGFIDRAKTAYYAPTLESVVRYILKQNNIEVKDYQDMAVRMLVSFKNKRGLRMFRRNVNTKSLAPEIAFDYDDPNSHVPFANNEVYQITDNLTQAFITLAKHVSTMVPPDVV